MKTLNLTNIIMVSVLICAGSAFAQEAAKAPADETAKTPEKVIVTPVANATVEVAAKNAEEVIVVPSSQEEAVAEIEASRRVIMEMKAPRDQHMAVAGEISKQIEARRKAIAEKNEDAAKLTTEIAELDKTLQEKIVALQAIFDADEALAKLQVKMQEVRDDFGKSQLKLREEISRQHHERRLAMEAAQQKQAAEQKEAAAKTDNAAAKTDEVTKEKAGQ